MKGTYRFLTEFTPKKFRSFIFPRIKTDNKFSEYVSENNIAFKIVLVIIMIKYCPLPKTLSLNCG